MTPSIIGENELRAMSVFPEWTLYLPLQQQSVLMLALRGPDGIRKHHPCKEVQRAYRGTMLLAAKYGRHLDKGEKADTFMSLEAFASDEAWQIAVDAFFESIDELPHHFINHIAHAAEIISYQHPDEECARFWGYFYQRWHQDAHINVGETKSEMCDRLSDWHHKHWSDPKVRLVETRVKSCLTSIGVEPEWGYANTVGNLIAQLSAFDPSTPIHGAFHADYKGARQCFVRGLALSRERVNGRKIETGNEEIPYSIVAWSAPQADPAPLPTTPKEPRHEQDR